MRIFIIIALAFCLAFSEDSNENVGENLDEESSDSNKINIISITPLDEDLSENDLERFVMEGILDRDSISNLKQNQFDDEFKDDDAKMLVNIYKKIRAKNNENNKNDKDAKSSDEANVDSATDSTSESADDEIPLLLENIYGHIGFFGKSNALNKSVSGSYIVFSASVGLQYDFKKSVFLDLGIYGLSPIMGGKMQNKYAQNLAHNYFTLNRANVKYVARDEFQNETFDITAGRFLAKRDWIRNFVQGVSVNANYEWFRLWLDWVDEQAIAHREYLSDFNVFKTRYNDKWLIAVGAGASVFGVDVLPYYYFFSGNLWAVGGKLGLDIDFANKKWRSVTTAHYVYANNKREFRTNERTESQIVWLEEAFRWRSNNKIVSLGLGYTRIFGASFELANVGNISRFESYNTQGYGIMGAGGIDNGGNSSNMFFADTQSFYGFAGFKIDDFSMMFLGRNSQGKNSFADLLENITDLNQHQYALSARWRIIEGLYIGGVGAFMLENKVNKSYAKGYIEFKI